MNKIRIQVRIFQVGEKGDVWNILSPVGRAYGEEVEDETSYIGLKETIKHLLCLGVCTFILKAMLDFKQECNLCFRTTSALG